MCVITSLLFLKLIIALGNISKKKNGNSTKAWGWCNHVLLKAKFGMVQCVRLEKEGGVRAIFSICFQPAWGLGPALSLYFLSSSSSFWFWAQTLWFISISRLSVSMCLNRTKNDWLGLAWSLWVLLSVISNLAHPSSSTHPSWVVKQQMLISH